MEVKIRMFVLVLFVAAGLAILSGSARAQGEGNILVYFHSGATLIAKPDKVREYWQPRLNFGFGIGYSFTPKVTVSAGIDYHVFGFDREKFEDEEDYSNYYYDERDNYGVRIFNFSGNVKYRFPSIRFMTPYATAGLGFMRFVAPEDLFPCWYDYYEDNHIRHCNEFLQDLRSESAPFGQAGAGVFFAVGRSVSMYLEGRYALGFIDMGGRGPAHYFPLNLGMAMEIR